MIDKKKFKHKMIEKDINQKAVAEEAGVNEGKLSQMLNHGLEPTFGELMALSKALNCYTIDIEKEV